MSQSSPAEEASAERAAWLAHIRSAVETAEQVAQTLSTDSENASEACALLARLTAIRSELDALQHLRPESLWRQSGPDWINLRLPPG